LRGSSGPNPDRAEIWRRSTSRAEALAETGHFVRAGGMDVSGNGQGTKNNQRKRPEIGETNVKHVLFSAPGRDPENGPMDHGTTDN